MGMKRLGKTAASAAVVAATLVGSIAVTAGTAQAAWADSTVKSQCNKPAVTSEDWTGWPGAKFLCGGGYGDTIPVYHFDDGTTQSFFIGTDYALWTTWTTPTGSKSPTVSLGGASLSDPTIVNHDGGYLKVRVLGTDGKDWYIERNSSGNWSPWHK
ncbi:hypothetical protein [Kitasatospora sp. NPDC008115]|uniref:hypothetical protein n=1 Tax=Kitasatospora sp. NPDC008115 TaxID=3364022 RepID=UPI0036E5AE39